MASIPKTVLLVGVSVRMLAQSAIRAGIRPISLDWFADTDTAESSSRCRAVSGGTGFDVDRLLWAAERYAPATGGAALVYGGGFDGDPALLSRLASGRTLLGNSPETLRSIKSPPDFFSELDRLSIPYPETRWSPPEEYGEPGTWLIKRSSSEGGVGVHWAQTGRPWAQTPPGATYFQRSLCGTPCSVLFLANGRDAGIIGYNTLWISDHSPKQPFLFGGARIDGRLGRRQRAVVRDYANTLTRAFALRGINSLDFVVDEGEVRVLEINPRPSATMALYDADYPDGLLVRHIGACRGMPIGPRCRPGTLRAFKILYAGCSMAVPAEIPWPDWCSDRPRPGTFIACGRPVCSIRAEAGDDSTLEQQLFTRERTMRSWLMF